MAGITIVIVDCLYQLFKIILYSTKLLWYTKGLYLMFCNGMNNLIICEYLLILGIINEKHEDSNDILPTYVWIIG